MTLRVDAPDRFDPVTVLRDALRLMVITDRRIGSRRSLSDTVRGVLAAGARAIQLRDKDASARELYQASLTLLTLTRPLGALLIVNDRVDVALAAGADGAHLGPSDLPLPSARGGSPHGFLLGFSTDDPALAIRAEAQGADYIGCGAVYGSRSKAVGDEAIGLARLDQVARAVRIPVLAIGGVTPAHVGDIAGTAAAGVAAIGAVTEQEDPGAATSEFLRRWATARGDARLAE